MDEVSELMQKRFFPLFALFERKNPEKQKQKKGKKTEKERKKSQTEKRGKKKPEKKKRKRKGRGMRACRAVACDTPSPCSPWQMAGDHCLALHVWHPTETARMRGWIRSRRQLLRYLRREREVRIPFTPPHAQTHFLGKQLVAHLFVPTTLFVSPLVTRGAGGRCSSCHQLV